MSRRPTGNGHDPRVVPFRPRKPQRRRPAIDWRQSLIMFVILFALAAGLSAVFGNGLTEVELITALAFALVVTGTDILRRRRGA